MTASAFIVSGEAQSPIVSLGRFTVSTTISNLTRLHLWVNVAQNIM